MISVTCDICQILTSCEYRFCIDAEVSCLFCYQWRDISLHGILTKIFVETKLTMRFFFPQELKRAQTYGDQNYLTN